jgi:hypothetical protein
MHVLHRAFAESLIQLQAIELLQVVGSQFGQTDCANYFQSFDSQNFGQNLRIGLQFHIFRLISYRLLHPPIIYVQHEN